MRTRALAASVVLAACLAATTAWARPGGAWPQAPWRGEQRAQAAQYAPGQRSFGPFVQAGRMSREERERLREDMRAAERDRYRRGPERAERGNAEQRREYERWREERMRRKAEGGRLTPEERDRLRRDVLDANRGMRR